MDYRLVKQFYNNAIDNFFNFFYKIVDFVKVLLDVLLSFLDIWITFFSIFANLFLYIYYMMLYAFDKMTMSSTGVFFWKRSYSAKGQRLNKVYKKDIYNPIPASFGKIADQTVSVLSQAPSAIKSQASAAVNSITSTAAPFKPSSPSGGKGNMLKSIGEALVDFGYSIWRPLHNFFSYHWKNILSKLKPVRETQPTRKSLIDDYIKEYEKKKTK